MNFIQSLLQFVKTIFEKPEPISPKPTPRPEPVPEELPHPPKAPRQSREVLIEELLAEAEQYLGTKETHGKNRSPVIDSIVTKAGGSPGSPYCMYFCQFIINKVAQRLNLNKPLYQSGATQVVWQKTPEKYKLKDPTPGALVFWQSRSNSSRGHVGFVESVNIDKTKFKTIEANTNKKGSREGEGILRQERSTKGSTVLRYLGCVDVVQMMIDAQNK